MVEDENKIRLSKGSLTLFSLSKALNILLSYSRAGNNVILSAGWLLTLICIVFGLQFQLTGLKLIVFHLDL